MTATSAIQTPSCDHILSMMWPGFPKVMERGIGSIWCLVLFLPGLLSGCYSEGEAGIWLSINYVASSTHCQSPGVGSGHSYKLWCPVLQGADAALTGVLLRYVHYTVYNLNYIYHTLVTVVINGYTHSSTLTFGDLVPLGTRLILVCRVVGLPYGTPLSYTWTCPNGPCEVEGYYGRKIYNEHILSVNTTSKSDGGTYTCQVTATGGQEASGSFTFRVTGMPNTIFAVA